MGRYARHDASERRTAHLSVKLTPSERSQFDAAASLQGTTPSDFARELLFRRAAAIVAATRRHPEAAAIKRELEGVGEQLYRVGNNLNQLAHRANESRRIASEHALLATLDELAKIDALLCRAVERVLGL